MRGLAAQAHRIASALRQRHRNQLTAWTITLVLFLGCVAARLALATWLEQATFIVFVPAIVLGTFLSGLRHGLFLLGMFGLVTAYAFMPPTFTFVLHSDSIIQLVVYSASGLFIVLLIANLAASIRSNQAANIRDALFVRAVTDYATFMLDPEGRVTNWNAGAERIKGYTASEIIGQHFSRFYTDEDITAGKPEIALAMARRDGHYEEEGWRRRKDGSRFWASAVVDAIYDDGQLIGFAKITRDLTDRLTAQQQLEHSRELLFQSQKMEAVGQLTGGLAHDFNNLLTGITGNLELMKRRIAQGRFADIDRFMTGAQDAASRAAALTHRLLAFARRQTLDPKLIRPNLLIANLQDLLQRTVGPTIELETVGVTDFGSALCDPHQLENAILNLCINARDAMPDGGRLTIETAGATLNDHDARAHDMDPGQYIVIGVTDTGTGIPSDVLAHVFEPFFTTKPAGRGTGLGLSMIYGFAKQSGGQVLIDSREGAGTTVRIYLPQHSGNTDAEAQQDRPAEVLQAGSDETILIVDDEPTVRTVITEVLGELGYAAIEVSDGASGLKVLQSDVRIDLLITDVGLSGGLNGRQMADAARLSRPKLPVLFITGYAESVAIGRGALAPGMHLMAKPFAMEALASRIKSIIRDGC